MSNRVSEIQSLIPSSSWYHCPGSKNPADLISRGMNGDTVVKCDLWFEGPDFLKNDSKCFQREIFSTNEEIKTDNVVCSSITNECLVSSLLKKCNNFPKSLKSFVLC